MNTTTQKPFACKAEGCGMSFTNEDHLTVHEKKHEMVLNLGLENKSLTAFVADQTPTPTRLIKNCEEVGLFDDLKHVNPFDETFRRAVESKGSSDQSGEIPIENASLIDNALLSAEDSLHTPHVFPNVEENRGEFKIEKQKVILSDDISYKARKDSDGEEKKCAEKQKVIRKRKFAKSKTQILNKVLKNASTGNSGQKLEVAASVPIILPGTISVIQPQVIALGIPVTPVTPAKRILLPKPPESANQSNSPKLLPVKERLKEVLSDARRSLLQQCKEVESNEMRNKSAEENSKHTVDVDWMERRRAAAMRYRRKIKKEQSDLKRKNAELAAENTELKAIIKHLKQALLAHQNCEISRATSLGTNIQLDDRSAIQIQPATVKLVMSIPKFVIQPSGKIPVSTVNVSNLQK